MNAPPGCPSREIVKRHAVAKDAGVTLKLSCGHLMWSAGFRSMTESHWPCLSGCYVPQREMGDRCD